MKISEIRAKGVATATVVYDEDFGVKFKLNYIDKAEMSKLNGQFTKSKFNPKTHQKEEDLDIEGLRKRICELGVVGWEGVTPRWLATLMPIDMDAVESPDKEIEFSLDELEELTSSTYGLDGWIFENVRNGENFNKNLAHKEAQIKN